MNCTHCGKPIEGAARFCTHCGATAGPDPLPAKKRGRWWKWPLAVMAVLMVVGMMLPDEEPRTEAPRRPAPTSSPDPRPSPPLRRPAPEPEPQPPPSPDLELLEKDNERGEFGNLYITGRIRNNTARKYRYVQVTFNLYDDDGNQTGTALANVNGLAAGGTWKFKAAAFGEDASRYRLDEITGY